MLSDSDTEEQGDLHVLTVNEHYARAFAYRKEREELSKLKEKYGSDFEDEDIVEESESESEETEDEDGEELTPAVDAALLRTLALIRNKDPGIYDNAKPVYEEEEKRTSSTIVPRKIPKDKSKAIKYKQQALSALVEGNEPDIPEGKTHVEEQEELRHETISAFHQAVEPKGSDDEDDDDLLVLREKTKDEVQQEEEDYRAFIEREVGDIRPLIWLDEQPNSMESATKTDAPQQSSDKKARKKAKRAERTDNSQADQEFLMNYILNRGWIDRSSRRLPTYQEVTSRGKGNKGHSGDTDPTTQPSPTQDAEGGEAVEEDPDNERREEDAFDDVADDFEASYNFRFEEPGGISISRHPRNIQSLVRRPDTSRKEARERKKVRKQEELAAKKEEMRRLKSLKTKELRAKLEKVEKEGGWKAEALAELDLEGDWDPGAHDRQMAELYENEEFDAEGDDAKPAWEDDIDIRDLEPGPSTPTSKKSKKKKKKQSQDDEAGVDIDEMDADVEPPPPGDDNEEWDGTEEMRKRKLDEYFDDIYGLEFNDLVGDMPTRFKYAAVPRESYALTPAEILMASDKELNAYVGLRKIAPYRKSKEWDMNRGERLKELKSTISQRSWGGVAAAEWASETTQSQSKSKKRKGKKEREKARQVVVATDGGSAVQEEPLTEEPKKKKRKRNKG